MKLRIVNKGTPQSNRVVNAETGEELSNVTKIEWTATPTENTATIHLWGVPVNVVTDDVVVVTDQVVETPAKDEKSEE